MLAGYDLREEIRDLLPDACSRLESDKFQESPVEILVAGIPGVELPS